MSRPSPVIDGDARLPTALAAQEHWLILVGKGNNGGDGVVAAGICVTRVYASRARRRSVGVSRRGGGPAGCRGGSASGSGPRP